VKERTGELRKVNDDLQSVNKNWSVRLFVSHDLRAPVRHIAGFTQLLQKHSDPVLDDKSRHHISMILDSATRMGNLVDDLWPSRGSAALSRKDNHPSGPAREDAISEIAPDMQGRKSSGE